MSLDVYLKFPGVQKAAGDYIFIREGGQTKEISREEWDRRFPGREPVIVNIPSDDQEVYSANITHNLGSMADVAGIYTHLWRPEELGITKAKELVEPLRAGLEKLRASPEEYKKHNPSNGWGNYDGLVRFVANYLEACEQYPEADVSAWR